MSLSINVYCKKVSKELVPKLMKRINDFDMVVNVHPDFKFDWDTDSGFLPFKFRLNNPHLDILKKKDLKSGFELYIEDFDLFSAKEALKPRLSFFDKLKGRKQKEVSFASPEIEGRLKDCKVEVSFVWHVGDSFAFRFAYLTAAILTELTNGVCTYENETWYDKENIVENAFVEIVEYEQTITEGDIEFIEFDEW